MKVKKETKKKTKLTKYEHCFLLHWWMELCLERTAWVYFFFNFVLKRPTTRGESRKSQFSVCYSPRVASTFFPLQFVIPKYCIPIKLRKSGWRKSSVKEYAEKIEPNGTTIFHFTVTMKLNLHSRSVFISLDNSNENFFCLGVERIEKKANNNSFSHRAVGIKTL